MAIRLARRFVVIATRRSGSTLLVRSLDTAPKILCAGELFHSGRRTHHAEFQFQSLQSDDSYIARVADKLTERRRIHAHLEHFYSQVGTHFEAVGFKVTPFHMRQYPSLLRYITTSNVIRIFLYRESTFEAALSNLRAQASGIYHSDASQGVSHTITISATPGQFRKHLDRCEAHKRQLLALQLKHGGAIFSYENLISQWNGHIEHIGDLLGLPGLQVSMSLDKLDRNQDKVTIENLSELKRTFGARHGP